MPMIETIPALLFYMFSTVLVISALMVVVSANPVHSVLFLILAFFNAAGLFLLLGAEFVAFILIIVYVGAVAVLFLFVVMMLDIDFKALRKDAWKVLPVGLLVGAVLAAQLVITAATWQPLQTAQNQAPPAGVIQPVEMGNNTVLNTFKPVNAKTRSNTHAIGDVLYTEYVYPFQVAGLILLVAMIGAITLTLRHRPGTLRQSINTQMIRTAEESMVVKKVEKGAGIE